MSADSNAGILVLASNAASVTGSVALPANAGILVSPRQVSVGVAQRVALTIAYQLTNPTTVTIRVRMTNNNTFGTPSAGSALPRQNPASVSTQLNQAFGVLSVAQADAQAGFQALDHVYGPGSSGDFIYIAGGLVGILDVLLTVGGGNSSANDYFVVAANVY